MALAFAITVCDLLSIYFIFSSSLFECIADCSKNIKKVWSMFVWQLSDLSLFFSKYEMFFDIYRFKCKVIPNSMNCCYDHSLIVLFFLSKMKRDKSAAEWVVYKWDHSRFWLRANEQRTKWILNAK